MIAVLWGLLAALLVGTSDAIARKTSQHSDLAALTLLVMAMSTAGMSVWFIGTGNWPDWHPCAWAASAASGSLNVVVLYLLYLALRRGPVSVASPAASTFTVMLVGWNALAGEPWSALQLLAVVIVFFGVSMLARKSVTPGIDDQYEAAWIRRTALLGLAAAFAVSVRMFLAQDASAILGATDALYLNRIFALITSAGFVMALSIRHAGLQWPTRPILGLIALQSMLETAALGVFLVGSAGPGRIGASIGFAAFAAVTVCVASVWLGERIGRTRALWVAVIVIGLMMGSTDA